MPLISKHTSPCRGLWKIEETADELWELLRQKSVYQPFLSRLRTEKRKQEWLASRVLLENLAGGTVRIGYEPNGSPYLPGSPLSISISHTRGYAAVLLQETPAAGTDIEYRSDRVLKIRHRFLSPAENAAIDPLHAVEHLLVYWCAKETLFKMIRREGVDFISHLHIEPFEYALSGRIEVNETHSSQPVFFRLAYEIRSDFVWVWSDPSDTDRVKIQKNT